MSELFSLRDKVALITGSSRGIGASLATGFAEQGAIVIINGTNSEKVAERVSAIREQGGAAAGYPFDITDYARIEASIAKIESEFGKIDVLVNNAGIHRRGLLAELAVEHWDEVIRLNLSAAFMVSKCVAQGMIRRLQGKIINITSLMAEGARPTTGNYCAAKGGLKMLTKSMAVEWGRFNIQVNAIGPGYFITDLNKPLIEDSQFDAWVKQKVPLGRWGDPSELIGTAVFLASQASDYVSGQTIYVDGGWLAAL
jgi:gluconate 5-dehydrogenase